MMTDFADFNSDAVWDGMSEEMRNRFRGLRVIAMPLCGVLADCNKADATIDGDSNVQYLHPLHANVTFLAAANVLFLAVQTQFPEINDIARVRNLWMEYDIEEAVSMWRHLKRLIYYRLREHNLV